MILRLLIALSLLAACVVLHAIGLTLAMHWLERSLARLGRAYGPQLRMLIVVAGWTVLIHLIEITVWAVYYAGRGVMPDLETALYFSAVTYTTTGYGDIVLPAGWRMLGGVEALTGILMCGWSTGFFFAIVNQTLLRSVRSAIMGPDARSG